MGVVADDADGGLDVVRVHGLAGGDGVHARGEALEDVEELLRLGDDAWEVGGEVDELAAPAVLLGAGLVVGADEVFEAFDVGGRELGVLVTEPRVSLPMPRRVRRASSRLISTL